VVHEWYTIDPVVSIGELAAVSLKRSCLVIDMKKIQK
jgi:hypothetical protein